MTGRFQETVAIYEGLVEASRECNTTVEHMMDVITGFGITHEQAANVKMYIKSKEMVDNMLKM